MTLVAIIIISPRPEYDTAIYTPARFLKNQKRLANEVNESSLRERH